MSKRSERVAAAKARPQAETDALRRVERSSESSKFCKNTYIPTKRELQELELKRLGLLRQGRA